ncbi:Lipoprotein LpqB beta-propeller domain-containing protein [Jatrophihabitans endophyticus]|uniref:Lipoprotein LpqB beta-propeller domain-containing protein n=1 Tax=Jatrophihabitans endophyticus TaxID=1206085 RepID=A0A1M5EY76_9ACTN|nr:LpqB family beta-propeller domain-containing protein [Jatrophihabitans endophyticus]SHF84194.1 Lipoprotein LpqB beta-propeller domain-containing protein [Jatrophihabitans endophyticus]
MRTPGRDRRRPTRARRVFAALVACWLLPTACTGVPTSSAPRTVEPIDIGNGNDEPVQPGPAPGADARKIVTDFLTANVGDPGDHGTARKYLAPSERADWSDATATIIADRSVGTEEKGVVTVRGKLVGSLNQNGVYVPQLQGTGDGGSVEQFQYRVAKVDGESRIVGLPAGLLLTTDQFEDYYRAHALYFFDQAHRYLVPDQRWSALNGSQLDSWLVGQLYTGPRPDLSSTLTNDTLPTPTTSQRRIAVTADVPIKVDVPGAAQLDARARRQLAAQIAATVTEPTSEEAVQLTDGGNTVPMPGTQTDFTARELYGDYAPAAPPADVFYLRQGNVVRQTGKPLDGRLRDDPYFLGSIAVTEAPGASGYTVAAVAGTGRSGRLVIGTQAEGYRETSVHGELSRPAWAPAPAAGSTAKREVWIGVDGKLERLEVDGNRAVVSDVSINAGAGGGRIEAVRLSPEGSRIAMVIESPNGSRRLFVGAVVRGAGQVRVDSLPSISPEGVSIDDAAWIGPQKLIAIGRINTSGDPRIFETNVDGSFWTGRTIGSVLPGQPDSVTVAVGQLAWVSSNGTVWQQSGRSWRSPGAMDQTPGDKPVYQE